jgi:hypothetical protein
MYKSHLHISQLKKCFRSFISCVSEANSRPYFNFSPKWTFFHLSFFLRINYFKNTDLTWCITCCIHLTIRITYVTINTDVILEDASIIVITKIFSIDVFHDVAVIRDTDVIISDTDTFIILVFRVDDNTVPIGILITHVYFNAVVLTIYMLLAGLDPCWSQTHYVGFVMTRSYLFHRKPYLLSYIKTI